MRADSRFARFAWGVLACDVAVVAWGAYVRATGSGAGCGRHWPLCNGEILPRSPRTQTLVELSHRVSSGVALVLTAALLAWAFRAFPRGHLVRKGASTAMLLMLAEAGIGAALVLFELVAHDASMKRALSVSMHLGNTFLLLAATALTAWWASGGARPTWSGQRAVVPLLAVPVVAMFFVGASGAVTALGDTLFPPSSLAAGLAQDLAPRAHVFVRLRALHPLFATLTAAVIVFASSLVRSLRPAASVRVLSRVAALLAIAQVGAGLLDVATLAPVWLQLVHLVMADAVWVALVLLSAAALACQPNAALSRAAPEAVTARP
ncbi:MAG TPA: COX15/CtaA family protein [Polyangiaceae bacterium]